MTDFDRISQIEQTIAGLEKQMQEIKITLAELKEAQPQQTSPVTNSAPQTTADTTDATAEASILPSADISADISAAADTTPGIRRTVQSAASIATGTKNTAGQTTVKEKTSSRFEENLGGKVMGIVAAVLVFVGLFLFGSALYERLGDAARIALLFLVSFLLLGAGLFLERKRRSWFTTSLVGCGFGAVYISLFITTLYFELLTTEVLYVLLFFWLVGIGLYVFRRQSYTVALLGQTGIAFSVIFGSIGAETGGQFTFLCIFFTVLSLLYLWVVLWRFLPTAKEKPYPWILLTAAGLNIVQLWFLTACYDSLFGEYGYLGGKNWFAGVLLCLYCLLLPLFFLLRQRFLAGLSLFPQRSCAREITEKTFSVYKAGIGSVFVYTVYQIVCWIVFSVIAGVLFEADVPHGLALLFGMLLSFLVTEYFGAIGTEGRGACIVTAVSVAFTLLFFDFPDLLQALVPMVFGTATLLFGLFGSECPVRTVYNKNTGKWETLCKQEKGRCFEKFTACTYFIPLLLSHQYEDSFGSFLLIALFGILFLGGSFVFLYRKGRTHRFADGFKANLYVYAMLHIFWTTVVFFDSFSMEDTTQIILTITVLTVCNSIAFYSNFRRLLHQPEQSDVATTLLVRMVHTALWIWSIALLHSGSVTDRPFLCIWLLLLTLFLCGSGMHEQYKTYRGKTGLGIYFGIRLTLYLVAVLAAFEGIEGYVISCALLLLAIAGVLVGFPLRLAPLRVYGLCLAMFAVIKLLMVDVEHDNSMETVLCFLGAGVLCFAINFIYNHAKKRFHNDASSCL